MTPTEAKRHRAQLHREIANELRAKDRITLSQIRARISEAQARRKEAIARARHNCKAARVALKARQRTEREKMKADQRAERFARRGSCESEKSQASREGLEVVKRTRGELRGTRAELRNIERAGKAVRLRSTAGERRAESDDAVRRNIPEDLVPVFDKVRGKIKASARRSRSEAFLEWAHENPEEIVAIQQADADKYLRELIAHEKAHGRIMRKATRYKPSREEVEKRLADVPF